MKPTLLALLQAAVLAATTTPRIIPSFEENRGQAEAPVRFLAKGQGFTVMLTPSEATWTAGGHTVRMTMPGARANPMLQPLGKLPGVSNYIQGSDRKRWITGVPHYARVRYGQVYAGIDAEFYSGPAGLEFDFLIAPRADPHIIQLAFAGAGDIHLDAEGGLVIGESGLRHPKPVAWQETRAGRKLVEVAYRIGEDETVRFAVGEYDPSLPLVIDPPYDLDKVFPSPSGALSVSAGAGDLFLAGYATTSSFPTTPGAYQPTSSAYDNAFVMRITAQGNIVYSTFLGGSSFDAAWIAADASGAACVAGTTMSGDFPVTAGAYQTIRKGPRDAFVGKLNASGIPIFVTYFGGSKSDYANAVDMIDGQCWIGGTTDSTDLPKVLYAGSFQGDTDGFVARFSATGAFLYSRYFGGTGEDSIRGIRVPAWNKVYITGTTDMEWGFDSFPLVNAFRTLPLGREAFVARLEYKVVLGIPTYQTAFSSLLGGSNDDFGAAIGVDLIGNMYVTGSTDSFNLPMSVNSDNGGSEAFLARINWNGTLAFTRYIGGAGTETAHGIYVPATGNVAVTGVTDSPNIAPWSGVVSNKGGRDAYFFEVSNTGGAANWGHVGGNGDDTGVGITRLNGNWVIAGSTRSDLDPSNGTQPPSASPGAMLVIY